MFETLAQAVDRWLGGEQGAHLEVERAVRELTVAQTIALAAGLRDRARSVAFSWRWGYLTTSSTATLRAYEGHVEIAGLLSLHRDGYVRAAAVGDLVRTRAPLALRFLALRLDDIVPDTRDHARAAIVARLERAYVDELVQLLPLLDRIARRMRAGASSALRDVTAFLASPAGGWTALLTATASGALDVRRSALRLAVRHAPRAADQLAVLSRGLADPDPALARWVAIEATSARVGDAVRAALLPALEGSRDPFIRRRAVLARARQPDATPYLERALVDRRAAVRYTARAKLPGRARAACLAALADPTRRLGALGGLAEVGHPEDASRAVPFVEHPDAAIRAEAIRCIGALAPEAHRALLERATTSSSARVRREAARALARHAAAPPPATA